MERGELVAQLKDVLGTALQDWVRSLDIQQLRALLMEDDDAVYVTPDSILVFNFQSRKQDIELARLRRILTNISNHCDDVYKYLVSLHESTEERDALLAIGREYALAARKLVTMRDSSWEMVCLLNGEDLDKGEEPDLPDEFTVDSLTVEQKQDLSKLVHVIPSDPFAPMDDPLLSLAQVHRQVRELQNKIPNDHFAADGTELHGQINRITDYIRSVSKHG